ncbi:hypothetical protein PHPALM_28483 [Phytophthora palmivora]|uniref:Uncharacterized protein n=1 Tax=Phytophthora palmivora TaxID=4796 RepID=A0A2P4XA16_9STRA|nr:hypothetical protein PHPALM_28483 [Phytophthora palmivora]
MNTGDWSGIQKQRGGSKNTPKPTLIQLVELVEQKYNVRGNRETVGRSWDARSFTHKKLHHDINNTNMQKRFDYVVKG